MMFVLPSLLAVSVWFTKPPLGSQARITVNNPSASTVFQIVGINKEGVELGPEHFSAKPERLTVGRNRSRQSFIRFNPDSLWAVCAVLFGRSLASSRGNVTLLWKPDVGAISGYAIAHG